MPGASVTARNEGTGFARTDTTTTDTGDYLLTQLPPGRYTVSAELTGFKTAQQARRRGQRRQPSDAAA